MEKQLRNLFDPEYAQSIQHFAGGARDFYDLLNTQRFQSLDGTMKSVISGLLSRLPQVCAYDDFKSCRFDATARSSLH